MSASVRLSVGRFLFRAGTHSRGTEAVLLLILAYGVVEWVLAGRSETALYLILFAVPFAAGTGLLTIARAGHLDLLFGAGATRQAVWLKTLVRAVGVPLVACLAAAPMFVGPGQSILEVAGRAVAIALFTGGVGFMAGMVNPRFAAGVVWIAARLVLILSGFGVKVLAQLVMARTGGGYPPMQDLFLSSLAFPEILLDRSAHPLYAVAVAAIGILSIGVSRSIFIRAELSGRRSA